MTARHPWCSYTDSRKRCAKPLSSLKTGTAPILTWKFASAPRPTPCRARMPGQYSTRGAFRPRLCDEGREADATARFFLCARCRAQVLICSCCDRGNIYCAQDCAQVARRSAQRAAGRRYQLSFRGRRNHAARARRYRARQNKVTHHGSLPQGTDDVMPEGAAPTWRPDRRPENSRGRRGPASQTPRARRRRDRRSTAGDHRTGQAG